jgi:DNA-binding response OmpR family regulator
VINAVTELGEDTGEVLLIAGESELAEMYRMKLELDGYRVITVGNVYDSTSQRAGWRPDLVLMDLDSAGAVRLVDLQRLRADPLLGNLPLLLLSVRSEAELRRGGLTLGPTDYLLRLGIPAGEGLWEGIAAYER